MKTAAIYARKSTEEIGRADDAKSVTRQIENARAFALTRGWTVLDEHVYVDDGISGAEFKKRLGLVRMRAALTPRAPFRVLIVAEQKAIGREASETGYIIKQLAQAGVEIFEYMNGRSLTPKTWQDKTMSAIQSGADEAHREQTSGRTHEAHVRLARAGRVTGGRVFGYRNQDVCRGFDAHSRPLRSHVERVIEPAEATVVRRIYELYDNGHGLKRIVKVLTKEGAAAPKPFARRDGLEPIRGWSPSTVRTILTREIYHGVIVWNKSRKRSETWGEVKQTARPAAEWITTPAEHLRLVPEDLWKRVAARRKEVEGTSARFASGRLTGRPPKHAAQNLLAGLATCGTCGGGLVVETSSRKNGRVAEYVCHRHRHNGTCANALRIPAHDMNEDILRAIEEHALTPEAIEQVIQLSEREGRSSEQDALKKEQKDIVTRVDRLVGAIEAGANVAALVSKLRVFEQRSEAIRRDLANLRPIPRLPLPVVVDRLEEWRRLLRGSVTQGRTVLQRVLRGRIVFTPVGDGYEFCAPTRFDRLFTGVASPRPSWMSEDDTTGLEDFPDGFQFERDYGALLEKIHGKGMASPTGMGKDGRWAAAAGGVSQAFISWACQLLRSLQLLLPSRSCSCLRPSPEGTPPRPSPHAHTHLLRCRFAS